jgi:hypothetical protein
LTKIALGLAGAALGALLTPFVGPEAIFEGLSVGLAVGGLLTQNKQGLPPLQSEQISSSANGAPIQFGYGQGRVAGQLIWAQGITLTEKTSSGAGTGQSQFFYWSRFAFGFGEGPAIITRIWGDSKLIYDANPQQNALNPNDFPAWDATTTYNPGNEVSDAGEVYESLTINTNSPPTIAGTTDWLNISQYPPYDDTIVYSPGDLVQATGTYLGVTYFIWVCVRPNGPGTDEGVIAPGSSDNFWFPIQAWYGIPTIYPGDELQNPDPLIQGAEGTQYTGANRGLCHAVWSALFPLANFGNRIPNIRAEVNYVKVRNIL